MSHPERAAAAARAGRPPSAQKARVGLCVLALSVSMASAARAEVPQALDLSAALALAHANSPTLAAARQRVGESRGELTTARRLLPENPEVEAGVGPRWLDPGVTGRGLAVEGGLSQRLEIGGQRGARLGGARASLASAEAEADAAARSLDLAVATEFWQVVAASERARIAADHEALARELVDIAVARYERGATSPLEVNAARIRLAEARRQRGRADVDVKSSSSRLALLVGLDPAAPPRVPELQEARLEAERARGALALYDAAVLGALAENLDLLRRMAEAGKVAPAEVVLVQRELLEGRLGHLATRLDVAVAEARLRAAAGLPVVSIPSGGVQ